MATLTTTVSNAERHYKANVSIADAYVAYIPNKGVSNPPRSLGASVRVNPFAVFVDVTKLGVWMSHFRRAPSPKKGFGYRVTALESATTALSLGWSLRNPKYGTLTRMRALPKGRYNTMYSVRDAYRC